MSTWHPYDSLGYNPFSVTECLHCGAPIQQPKHGGRPRRYCDKPACRKAGSRVARKLEAERTEQKQRDNLRLFWNTHYDQSTIAMLEEILDEHGINAATHATEALKREMEALRKLAEARQIVAEAEKQGR